MILELEVTPRQRQIILQALAAYETEKRNRAARTTDTGLALMVEQDANDAAETRNIVLRAEAV